MKRKSAHPARKTVSATAKNPSVDKTTVDKSTERPWCRCSNAAAHSVRSSAGVCKAPAYSDEVPPPRSYGRRDATPRVALNEFMLPQFKARCKMLGLTIELRNAHNPRAAYWKLYDKKTDACLTTGFDVDVTRALDQMEQRKITLEFVDLFSTSTSAPQRSNPSNLTGGPFCVVCDTAGGLPCPSMVRNALKAGIKLAYPPGDARLVPNHVHPGRCRKRLRQWLDASQQVLTGKILAKHGDT